MITKDSPVSEILSSSSAVIQALRANPRHDLQTLLKTPKSIKLDPFQAASLISGLTQDVSLIQGPPGTGKSFIGTLIAKALHDFTHSTILVVCYTNHALDDILTGLLDIGIPEASMVRLGGKPTTKTESISIHKQNSNFRRDKGSWALIDGLKKASEDLYESLQNKLSRYLNSTISFGDILNHLEFEDSEYFEAFQLPQVNDGAIRVGKKGKAVDKFYLLHQWCNGKDAGIFRKEPQVRKSSEMWAMPVPLRRDRFRKWMDAVFRERIEDIYATGSAYNDHQHKLSRHWAEKDTEILRSKRIIGCTTTAAAKYSESIQAASPDVLLIEEAGEILESHVIAALGPKISQLIMIGDHRQLRPKVNHYQLTVEKGDGYDLNRSLFERLIIKGYPHQQLTEQHRMRPEISALIRALTYPELVDASSTQNRPRLRGVQDNIIFINHEHPEDDAPHIADRQDGRMTSSKQNTYEVNMVLKILRYLGQQGYGTDAIVLLTPYLGQLHKLQDALKKDNDPVLNDLDSFDLVRAGLLSATSAKLIKRPIRLATIDNYQGEESDIVIISLTRSNAQHDIGFMFSPERLNVLLSRARNALIMIGNARTFVGSRKGGTIWKQLFDLLRLGKHIYEGMPVECDRHNYRKAILSHPEEFDEHCPDGGCMEPCDTRLSCGLHNCRSRCHQLSDHSKMLCLHILYMQCPSGHPQSWVCHKGSPAACKKCETAAKLADKKLRREYELQLKRDAEQFTHIKTMVALDEKIAEQEESMEDARIAEGRAVTIRQKKKDLHNVTDRAARVLGSHKATHTLPTAMPPAKTPPASVAPLDNRAGRTLPVIVPSASHQAWERQKLNGEMNDSIDAIMSLTGLEEVKNQIMGIKTLIDTTKRQGASLKQTRFNLVLMGNPGTGKTTVGRLYAKFLASVQVLPNLSFIEITGARLANDGVNGIKKILDSVINDGGGAIFIDEAYQLTSDHNVGGKQVLDFLLAEMENNIGTIIFILAGYHTKMEKFFEHNLGLTSRFPYKLPCTDFTDAELLLMLENLIKQRNLNVESGVGGLYTRIAIKRLGRGRGKEGFGNARDLQNVLDQVLRRQAKRLDDERSRGQHPDDMFLCMGDLIGPDPSMAILESAAWREMQSLIGLQAVKDCIHNLISLVTQNYQRELLERKPLQVSLNRVFLGSPGTGKTSVAHLYGRILADLGLISSGEVVMKNPADFIGSILGESETKTKAILTATRGKVLIIDEAYMLYGGVSGKNTDIYRTAVIDTIVAEVQSVPGEDRCVLLLGYREQILEMFQNVNPGLSRRFAIEDAFNFQDFNNSQLMEILNLKLRTQDLSATDTAKAVAIKILDRSRSRPNFGNAGEVENLINRAKSQYQARKALEANIPLDIIFEPQDFDIDFDRDAKALTNLTKLFEDVVGCEEIVGRLRDYQQLACAMKSRNIDDRDQIPTNFIFKGPPGTGKTTIARKMGQVYYDMGILSSSEVIECSASDLVGQYVGHTGVKTKQLLEKALGRVLFIDEAYRLSEGHFAKEAVDELVGLLTQEKFKSKVIVILAGYDQDINKLLSVNSGLASRFPEQIQFKNMSPSHCLEVLRRELVKKDVLLSELGDLSSTGYTQMATLIEELSTLPSWGNARDIITLSRNMIKKALLAAPDILSQKTLILPGTDAMMCIETMLSEQRERCINVPRKIKTNSIQCSQYQMETSATPRLRIDSLGLPSAISNKRDAGVTDAVWNELLAHKNAAENLVRRNEEEAAKLKIQIEEQAETIRREQALAQELTQNITKDNIERQELKRKREANRLKELEARRIAAILQEKCRLAEERKVKEANIQTALRNMGVCVAGYHWIKGESGYRCAGGSHFVSSVELGLND